MKHFLISLKYRRGDLLGLGADHALCKGLPCKLKKKHDRRGKKPTGRDACRFTELIRHRLIASSVGTVNGSVVVI